MRRRNRGTNKYFSMRSHTKLKLKQAKVWRGLRTKKAFKTRKMH